MTEIKGYIGETERNNITYYYYTDGNDVFKAPKGNVEDCRTGYLIGRWECSLIHFNNFKDSVYSFLV